jgi:protein phosphatase PTC1
LSCSTATRAAALLTSAEKKLAETLSVAITMEDGGATPSAMEKAFTSAFNTIDQEVCALDGDAKSGATVVAALVRNKQLHVANAGDARAVLSRGDKAVRLSYDHKATDDAEVKRCTDAGASFLWGRLQGQTAITRALGDQDLKPYCISTPYYTCTELTSECRFVILACDGVWDVLTDDAAVALVKDLAPDASAMAQKLVNEALRLESKDNLTAAVIAFK